MLYRRPSATEPRSATPAAVLSTAATATVPPQPTPASSQQEQTQKFLNIGEFGHFFQVPNNLSFIKFIEVGSLAKRSFYGTPSAIVARLV